MRPDEVKARLLAGDRLGMTSSATVMSGYGSAWCWMDGDGKVRMTYKRGDKVGTVHPDGDTVDRFVRVVSLYTSFTPW